MFCLYCINLLFPPIGVTQADVHVTGHPYGLVFINIIAALEFDECLECTFLDNY